MVAVSASCLLVLPSLLIAQPAVDPAPDAAAPVAAPEKARKPRAAGAAKKPRVQGTTYVRVFHAIAGGPTVDLFVDGGKKAEGLSYKKLSDYLALPSGSRTFSIKRTGSDETLASLKKSAQADKYYVLAAATVEGKPGFVWQNEVTGKVREGRGSVRVYHLAAGAPTVAITTPSARGKAKMRTLVKELVFGKPRMVSLVAGTASLQVRAGDKMLAEAPATIEVGKRYAVFATGDANTIELTVAPAGK
jgi:hypothetical protein